MKFCDLLEFKYFLFLFIFLVVFIVSPGVDEKVPAIEKTINFSSAEYKDIDLWKDNITFETRNQDGELVLGKEWFGVNGIYSEEKPLIFGENIYTYWVENDSYIIIPQELIPDVYHVKQKVVAQAYKIRDIEDNDFDIIDHDYFENISFKEYEGDYLIAKFDIKYYAEDEPKFPIGALLIIEHDRNMKEVECNQLWGWWNPRFYYTTHRNSTITTFKFERDTENNEIQRVSCHIVKHKDKQTNNEIKFSMYPINLHITEEMELRDDVEDRYYNLKTKRILEKVIVIGEEK